MDDRDANTIALTHVCRAWREVFVSRPTLWTDLNCVDLDKTRVYLERSKSSPINLSMDAYHGTLSDAFFDYIPDATGRLKSVDINVGPENLQLVSASLSLPAPLLEVLSVRSYGDPVFSPAIFNGDLSSLHELQLVRVRTGLPWRNMVNLTLFALSHESPISVGQFLDFFESAPHLCEIDISPTTVIPDAQNGRLVPLPCLQRMNAGHHPSSSLFDHLLIPVGTRLTMGVDLPSPPIEGRPPRFIDNLKNLSNVTAIKLDGRMSCIYFDGPSGKVWMNTRATWFRLLLGCLANFDTSKTERLELIQCSNPPNGDPVCQLLLPMKDLRTLKLDRCEDSRIYIHALDPKTSSSGDMICPKLEELFVMHEERAFDIKNIVVVAAVRASRGAKLKSVKIVTFTRTRYSQPDVLELKKHVLHVECS